VASCGHGPRLRWHLHDLWPELEIPAGALDRIIWLARVARKLARAEQTGRVRIPRELLRAIRDRTRRAAELQREITALVSAQAPELLALPGCGALSAAKLIAETAGVEPAAGIAANRPERERRCRDADASLRA
jgi:transposase